MKQTQEREEMEPSRCPRSASCVTPLRSEAALLAAPGNRPRVGLLSSSGVLRDRAWQVYDGLDVFSQEPIGGVAATSLT